MEKLDKKDLRILYELDKNARQPISKIAKKVGLSNELTTYRIKRLEKLGIIKGYYTIVDYSLLGYTDYKVLFKLKEVDEKKLNEIIEFLKKKEFIAFISTISGKWDLNVDFFARNITEFDNLLSNVIEKFHNQLSDYDIIIKIEAYQYLKDYLYKDIKSSKERIYFYGAPGKFTSFINLDKTDKAILKLLSKNARINVVDIAKKLKLAPNTVKYRIKNYEKQKIILGYRPLIDITKLNVLPYILFIRFEELNTSVEKRLIQYCNQNPNIFYLIKLLGEFHYHIEIETFSREELQKIITDLRTLFKNNIRESEIIVVFQDQKLDFFPIE